MASTYSNLKIQLMGTGDNNTSWGDVTNVNIGAALGAAIASSKTLTYANANQTLTWTDTNAPQDARFLRLNLTGSATTGYDLILPVITGGKPYIINNGTDGTITVKHSTGTNIAVPTSTTTWVYADGTNVVDVVSYLSSVTTTNLTATTVLDPATIGAASPGFRGLPQNAKTVSYTLELSDAGKHISTTAGGVIIPANSSTAFPVGTTIVIYNNSASTQTLSITTDTLLLAGTATGGPGTPRTIVQRGLATCVKVASTTWVVSGNVS